MKTRTQTVNFTLASGSSSVTEVRERLDDSYKKILGVVAYVKSGNDQNFNIALQKEGITIQNSTYFKDYTIDSTSTLNPSDRYKPLQVANNGHIEISIKPNETTTAAIDIDFVFLLAVEN